MPQRTNRIGRHLATSGGLEKTLETARELGCETAQIFVSNPQSWADPIPRPDAEAFAEGRLRLGLSPVVAHAKYLINLASPDDELRGLSAKALAQELVAAAGFAGVSGRVAEPAVENSVGAGYDLSTPGGARSAAEELKESVGPAVALVHLNDARNGFGSHRDGHSKIGEGQIRGEAWVGLFAGLPGVPVIVETPYGGPEADAEEVRPVKELAGGLRKAPDGI